MNNDRWREIDDGLISMLREMIFRVAEKKGHLISRAEILADHIHIAVGCGIRESPGEVAVGYMKTLAYAAGMKPIFMSSYHVGTFGEYDLGAIREKRRAVADNRRPAGTSPTEAFRLLSLRTVTRTFMRVLIIVVNRGCRCLTENNPAPNHVSMVKVMEVKEDWRRRRDSNPR